MDPTLLGNTHSRSVLKLQSLLDIMYLPFKMADGVQAQQILNQRTKYMDNQQLVIQMAKVVPWLMKFMRFYQVYHLSKYVSF